MMPETDETRFRVLLVDDEADIRDVLSMPIADMGFAVTCAENGLEGYERFMKEAPHIVLTDIKMPVMDGIELLKRIKQENPETEVVMITGHGDMDLAIESLKNEATDFHHQADQRGGPGDCPDPDPGQNRHASKTGRLYPQP